MLRLPSAQSLAKRSFTIGAIVGVIGLAVFASSADASLTTIGTPSMTASSRATSISGTPLQILSRAEGATLAARSVTLTEHLVANGVPISIKLQGRWPDRVQVSIATEAIAEAIIIESSSVYVKANEKAWALDYKLSSTGATEMSDQWFVTSRTDPELGDASLSSLNPKALERPVFKDLKAGASELKEQLSQFDGRPAIKLSDATGAIFVSSTGKPYVLRIISYVPTSHGFLDFSSFNSSTKFVTPPGTASNLDAALAQAESTSTA